MAAHGASAYANRGCHCAACREAHRVRCGLRRAQRMAVRELVDGRWVAPLDEELHGRPSSYANHGCRCRACSEAWADYGRAARERVA